MPLESADPADLGLCPQRTSRLRAIVQDEVDRQRVPGAVLLLARRGRIGLFDALGVQDPAGSAAMQRDTIFRLYSMTKPVVSVALMMLVAIIVRIQIKDTLLQTIPALFYLAINTYLCLAGF